MKRNLLRLIFFLSADIILIFLAVFFAFLLRFEAQIPTQHFLNIWGLLILCLFFCLPAFYFFKLYFFSWKYFSTEELVSLVKALFLSFLCLTAFLFIFRNQPVFIGLPRSTLFISFFLIFLFCGGFRLSKRLYSQVFSRISKKEKDRTLIVGAGDAGEQILRNILASKTSPYFPIGFVDDNDSKQGMTIHNLKVLGRLHDISDIVRQKDIEAMIIASPSVGGKIIQNAVRLGRLAGLKKIKIVPPMNEIINGQISLGVLREASVGDLLGREQVLLDKNAIANFIFEKAILVTGAGGSIGSELCRQIAKFKPSLLLLLDQDETGIFNITEDLKEKFPKLKIEPIVADILDKEKLKHIFAKFSPKIVFHAAAYKHVPLMEQDPIEAVKNNIFGTKAVADVSLNAGVEKFIFISTDKAVNPKSIMGATKRIGEMLCQTLNNGTKFISVRFGNVLDSRGSVIPIFREKIKKREAIKITHPEMKRYFMLCSEACLLVMQAGTMGQGREVFVLDMGDQIKIIDLARDLIHLSGLEPDKDIPIVFTEPRPGEKLAEQLLTAEEGTVTTSSEKIFKAKLTETEKEDLNSCLKMLEQAQDKKTIIDILKKLIPSYKPYG